ncbi:LysR family transcriptional regulator [Acidipropionibacterium virtanenii]|uniref:Putative hydrogen peroxide-inducible genes activator n=1 Tax=Acidipropionibacterium virtanenii TaxID=2057246 RepID=A0A344UYA5_9ACTN|nr:LysR family transcriptional regulator [Acidipropionibacterium virtanenii]AXE40253.1 putative hydrogen peroxide-inducible genes activator [Acidipropionibacterium virtanenii]
MAPRLNPDALRYASVVAETGSFSAAARALGVTQPALSNGIARLETQLGHRLFSRTSHGVAPTPFGDRMLPLIDRAVRALDTVTAEARRWDTPATGVVRMGVSPLINPALVARARDAVRGLEGADGEEVRLVLRQANLADLRDALVAGDLDIIVIPSVEPMPCYEHRVIDSEPVVLVEERGSGGRPASLEDLAGKDLIMMPDTCGLTTFTRDLLAERVPVRHYPGEATSYQVLEEWSRLGIGSALLPLSRLGDPDGGRPIRDGDTDVEIFYEAVWDPNSLAACELAELAGRLAG